MLSERTLNYLDALSDGAVNDLTDAYFEQQNRIARLEAENARLRKDAERYQWLVSSAESDHESLSPTAPCLYAPSWNFSRQGWDGEIDEAIDAAMDMHKNQQKIDTSPERD